MEPCWLCQYTQTADAKTIASYISDNMGCASTCCIALQVAADLQERYPNTEGTSYEAVVRHIESHSLHPVCRIATMLRGLLRLSDDLQQSIRKVDEDGNPIMDAKLVETYLKVQAQIMTIYRTNETNKLLFSEKNV